MPYVILICLLALGGGYAYHSVTVSNLETQVVQLEANNRTLKENQIQLELAVKTSQESLRAAEENAKKSEAAMSALTAKNNQLQREKDNAMKIFKDHNLTRLARAKPGMIEKRMNAKTEQVFRMLENDTKELMDADDSDTPADGVRPEQDIRDQSNPNDGAR
jgi:chromosome segregation ATPase